MLLTSFFTFLQIILVDIILSGDNAVIIGALTATLALNQRNSALLWGGILAGVLRIVFTLVAAWLLKIPMIMLIGSLLLFRVAWGLYNDLRDDGTVNASNETPPSTFWRVITAVAIADISMSLDNILGVVGVAQGNMWAIGFGIAFSVAIMIFGAKVVSLLIERNKWIAWVGLALIVFVAGRMFVEGVPPAMAFVRTFI
jgi:YjbE family integral membrane protein